jgi:hypothetical protein
VTPTVISFAAAPVARATASMSDEYNIRVMAFPLQK